MGAGELAAAIDHRIWRVLGDPLLAPTASGPLDGHTVAVKDLFAVAGHRRGAGNPDWLAEAEPEPVSAWAVTALLDAGAMITGIAHTDEFAYSIAGRNAHYGTPPNIAVPGAIPGGSSSGPAAAVAAGQASIGLGTDTAGSIRVPASYQGLWGIRTTHGSIPEDGVLPLAPSFDTVGWLTRDAVTLAAAARASGAGDLPLTGAEVVMDASLLQILDAEVSEAFFERIAALDPTVIDLGEPVDAFEAFRVVQGAEAWAQLGPWITAHPDSLSPDIAARFAWARAITPDEVAGAAGAMKEIRRRLDDQLAGRILLLPTTPTPAPSLAASTADLERIRMATLTLTALAPIGGYPAVSAPYLSVPTAGRRAPVGLCFVGPRGTDLALIAFAEAAA